MDLRAEQKRMHVYVRHLLRKLPDLQIMHSDKLRTACVRYARGTGAFIRLRIGPDATRADVLDSLLWATVAAATPPRDGRGGIYARVRHIASALWPALDSFHYWDEKKLGRALAQLPDEDLAATVPAPDVAPLPRLAAARKRTDARLAHAEAKLAEHLQQLERERRLVRKWRAKVAGYRCRMAKRPVHTVEQADAAIAALVVS